MIAAAVLNPSQTDDLISCSLLVTK